MTEAIATTVDTLPVDNGSASKNTDPQNDLVEPKLKYNQLDPRQITVNRISGLIFSVIVTAGIIIGLLVFLVVHGSGPVWLLTAAAGSLIAIFLFSMAIFWPQQEFNRTAWRLDETGLEIHRGVFWRHRISVPYARVQHADVSQGPLQRQFELAKLTVHTAGTQNASVELDGIAHNRAIGLRDEIIRQRETVDVV